MSRRKKEPLRALTDAERSYLEQLSRAQSAPLSQVIRAKLLLAVADGRVISRPRSRSVGAPTMRFRTWSVASIREVGRLTPRHGGGPAVVYGPAERERILQEFRRSPDRAGDGTATWSLTTLQRALRTAPDGLPTVSTFTILAVLHDAGLSWQHNRAWCETGQGVRVRKAGVAQVTDPDAGAKKR